MIIRSQTIPETRFVPFTWNCPYNIFFVHLIFHYDYLIILITCTKHVEYISRPNQDINREFLEAFISEHQYYDSADSILAYQWDLSYKKNLYSTFKPKRRPVPFSELKDISRILIHCRTFQFPIPLCTKWKVLLHLRPIILN